MLLSEKPWPTKARHPQVSTSTFCLCDHLGLCYHLGLPTTWCNSKLTFMFWAYGSFIFHAAHSWNRGSSIAGHTQPWLERIQLIPYLGRRVNGKCCKRRSRWLAWTASFLGADPSAVGHTDYLYQANCFIVLILFPRKISPKPVLGDRRLSHMLKKSTAKGGSLNWLWAVATDIIARTCISSLLKGPRAIGARLLDLSQNTINTGHQFLSKECIKFSG